MPNERGVQCRVVRRRCRTERRVSLSHYRQRYRHDPCVRRGRHESRQHVWCVVPRIRRRVNVFFFFAGWFFIYFFFFIVSATIPPKPVSRDRRRSLAVYARCRDPRVCRPRRDLSADTFSVYRTTRCAVTDRRRRFDGMADHGRNEILSGVLLLLCGLRIVRRVRWTRGCVSRRRDDTDMYLFTYLLEMSGFFFFNTRVTLRQKMRLKNSE